MVWQVVGGVFALCFIGLLFVTHAPETDKDRKRRRYSDGGAGFFDVASDCGDGDGGGE